MNAIIKKAVSDTLKEGSKKKLYFSNYNQIRDKAEYFSN